MGNTRTAATFVFVRTMTSLEVTEFATELGKGNANLHPSFGGLHFCSVGMIVVFLKAIFLLFYIGNHF